MFEVRSSGSAICDGIGQIARAERPRTCAHVPAEAATARGRWCARVRARSAAASRGRRAGGGEAEASGSL